MITFGRIGNVDEETDRKDFFQNLEFFMDCLTGFIYKYDTFTEIEIIEKIKKKIKGFDPKQKPSFFGDRIPYCINFFLQYMGMSYYTLTLKEKEEILVMDFTYENWKEKSIKIINNYIERSKNVCPDEIDFCFDDICFVFYVQINHGCEFTLNNFLTFIRDYFILDKSKSLFEEYRNAKIYEDNKYIVKYSSDPRIHVTTYEFEGDIILVGIDYNTELFGILSTVRKNLAEELNVPPFIILADSVLIEMCIVYPTTLSELYEISGVSKYKADNYGKYFLHEIQKFVEVFDYLIEYKAIAF